MTEWLPAESDDVAKVATPEPLRAPDPSKATPSRKLTVPVGVPAPGGTAVAVAVKVTDRP